MDERDLISIITLLEKREKYLSLPPDTSFLKIISLLGFKNKKEFLLKFTFLIFNEFKTIESISRITYFKNIDFFTKHFPNLNLSGITENESKEFLEYLTQYIKIFIMMMMDELRESKTEIENVKYILSMLDIMEKDSQFLFQESYLPVNIKQYIQDNIKSIPLKNEKNNNYFIWIAGEKKRKSLFDLLKIQMLIENNFELFCQVVSIDKPTDINSKIRWVAEKLNLRQIAYLFHQLLEYGMINKEQKRRLNSIISRRISDKNGNSITSSTLSKTYSNFLHNPKHLSEEIVLIDTILQQVSSIGG